MLRNWLHAGPLLSRGVVRLIAAACALLYVIVYWQASSFLPDFIFRDAEKIQAQIGGSDAYAGSSFDAVAKFYAILGPELTTAFVVCVGCTYIWTILCRANRFGLVVAALILMLPCMLFNL